MYINYNIHNNAYKQNYKMILISKLLREKVNTLITQNMFEINYSLSITSSNFPLTFWEVSMTTTMHLIMLANTCIIFHLNMSELKSA